MPAAAARRRPRPRLTVLRALGLGDLLAAVPALRALARAFPDHQRLLLAPRALAPLLPLIVEGGRPCLDGIADLDGVRGLDPAGARAAPPRPRLAVNLHGRGPRSHRLLLAARPERLLAFRHPELAETAGMPAWRAEEHEVERWCRLLSESGVPADPAQLAIAAPPVAAPARARGATVLHPGAASGARRWPAERWAALARAERAAGRPVVLTGSAAEAPLAGRVAALAGLPPEAVFAGAGDLLALAALLAAAAAVVCGDTGVGHLATALGVPSVLLFGPTPPALWGPPAGSAHRVLWAGRRGDPHAAAPDPGLLRIEPEAVLAELRALRAPAGRGGERAPR